MGLSLAAHCPVGEDGYFMLTLSPGRNTGRAEPRDVTVVMDVSGSMSGEKIEQARSALRGLLGTLSAADRFRLVAFSSQVSPQAEGWTPARGDGLLTAEGEAHVRSRRLVQPAFNCDRIASYPETMVEYAARERECGPTARRAT